MGEGCGGNVLAVILRSVGETDLVQGIEVEVFLGGNLGGVWSEEAGGDEKLIVLVFAHESNGFGDNHAIGLLFVRALGCEPAERSADLAVGLGVEDLVFVDLVATLGIDRLLPRGRIVKTVVLHSLR